LIALPQRQVCSFAIPHVMAERGYSIVNTCAIRCGPK
jgi:hypothetical protein